MEKSYFLLNKYLSAHITEILGLAHQEGGGRQSKTQSRWRTPSTTITWRYIHLQITKQRVFTLQDEVQTLETAEITNTNRDDAEVFFIIFIHMFW